MKTLFLFEQFEKAAFFFELEGDYRHLQDVYINSYIQGKEKAKGKALQDELCNLVYDQETGKTKVIKLTEPTKDWDYFVHCGFIP